MDVRHVALANLDLTLARLRQLPEGPVLAKVASLRRQGQLSPLVAAEQDGALILVDGFLRYQAALRLSLPSLLVSVVRLPPPQMKAQVYLRNRERGLLLIEECRLIQELADLDGLTQIEIADLLERHKSWVCRRLALFRSLSPHLLAHPGLGLLTGGAMRRLAQLPTRNQEEVMAACQREGLDGPDVGTLCDLFRQAPDPLARRYLLDQPRAALALGRQPTTPPQNPHLSPAARTLLQGLQALRDLSLRLERAARADLGCLPPSDRDRLAATADTAEDACRLALAAARQAWAPSELETACPA